MDTPQSFGQWLRSRRRGLDLTQLELARRVGCAQVTVKKLEADELRPSRQLAEALIKQLEVAPEERDSFVKFARGASYPQSNSLASHKHNLPLELSSFIGRERELVTVKQLVMDSRLVTLTGAGGVGKTRLSILVGEELVSQFQDGVWFVEFALISNPGRVADTALSVFNLGEGKGKKALEILQEYLSTKKALIILDNCEHVIDAVANLALALLKVAPGIKVLATSREALNVQGEISWRVPSLSMPDVQKLPSHPSQLTQYEAVRLFIERASLVSPNFDVNKENAPAIAQICFQLDGIPLAIELAAARVKMMTVEQINNLLVDRFRLLTGGSRTALPRQQTLRALIDWSYDLLSEPEKILLRRISVFMGGWTLPAAEQVCSDEKITRNETLDLLTHLIDKSLVIADERAGETRYHILETVRQYAYQKLLENGEESALRERHLDHYREFVKEIEPKLKSSGQLDALYKLQAELDNVRAALGWSFSDAKLSAPEKGLSIACALSRFWELDFRFMAEGLAWYKKGLTLLSGNDPDVNLLRARSLCLAGNFTSQMGIPASGRALLEEGISIYKQEQSASKQELIYAFNAIALTYIAEGNKLSEAHSLIEENIAKYRELGAYSLWDLAESLRLLGWNYYWHQNYELALKRGQESLSLFRQLGDLYNISDTVYLIGQIAQVTREFAAARPYYEECLSLNEKKGYKEYAVISMYALADLNRLTGNYPAAKLGYTKALVYYKETCDRFAEGATLINLGRIALLENEIEDAMNTMRKGLFIIKELHRPKWEAIGLTSLADVYRAKGETRRAVQWLGAIQAQSKSFNPQVLANYRQIVDATKKSLDEKSFTEAWAEGCAMTLDQAVEAALQDGNNVRQAAGAE
jgi:predicted ATPase/DNA-binding XRE family transcriptional regulator